MRLRHLALVALSLSLSASLGCSSSVGSGSTNNTGGGGATNTGGSGGGTGGNGGSGGSVECTLPTGGVPLQVPSDPGMPAEVLEADGTFAPTSEGFDITTSTETLSIFGVHPAVPQGTFVHVTYGATQGFYGPPGAFVRIDNLETLDGQTNPTEAGKRVWYFAASGGGDPAAASPFPVTPKSVCTKGEFPGAINSPGEITLTGPGFTVTVAPGEEGTFTVASGDDAGSYVAKNVNVQFIGAPGGDAWTITNFTIARSP